VVDTARSYRPRSPLSGYQADGYRAGLLAAQLLAEHFPAAYDKHVAARAVTPSHLYAVAVTFLSLVNRHMFPLQDSWDFELVVYGDIVAGAFGHGEGDDVCLSSLVEGKWQLQQPNPAFYGIGVQLAMGDGLDVEPEELQYDALTVFLWWLADRTQWRLGVDLGHYTGPHTDELADVLEAASQLPPGTPMEDLCAAFDAEPSSYGASMGRLLAYAFGQTDNCLADTSYSEILHVYEGRSDLTWNDTRDLIKLAVEAQQIASAYEIWHAHVATDSQALLALSARLCELAAPLAKEATRTKTLIELLVSGAEGRADPTWADDYPYNLGDDGTEVLDGDD